MPNPYRIGWVLDSSPEGIMTFPWQDFSSVAIIRYGGIAKHLHRDSSRFRMSLYRPWRRYDAVVFVKMMNDACYALAQSLRRKGTKVVFDVNVNYYEKSGVYRILGTEPSAKQMERATRMTSFANLVIADSTYLEKVCRRFNARVEWIPDAVDTDHYRPEPQPRREAGGPLRLIWSGVAKKAEHLELIEAVLERMRPNVELLLVSDDGAAHNPESPVIQRLLSKGIARREHFSYQRYPAQLRAADVIISPKQLENAYELAHTEYKITLGMACGLPAAASLQPSYVEAIGQNEGGLLCRSEEDWTSALRELSDRQRRETLGRQARQRVLDHYSLPVIAARYGQALESLFA